MRTHIHTSPCVRKQSSGSAATSPLRERRTRQRHGGGAPSRAERRETIASRGAVQALRHARTDRERQENATVVGAFWTGRREPVPSRGAAKAREWTARGEQLGCRAGTDDRRPGGSSLRRLASDEQTARSPPEHAHTASVHIVRRRLTDHEQPPNTPHSPPHTPTTTPPASVSPSRHPIARTRMAGEGRVLTTSPSA